jgi:hypothetical protein
MGTKTTVYRTIVTITLPLLLFIGFWQHQNISDWWKLRSYDPPNEITLLAERTSMTGYARRLFYVYRPQLNTQTEFNTNCTDSEYSIVLGCYVSREGIYIYAIDDPRLEGIMEVTAAHEMLHAAYARLSSKERTRIDALLQREYENLTNERILSAVEAYRNKDPAVVPNELHSIIGTEVRLVNDELEEYYTKYFTDRQAVVGFSEQYENAFAERKALVATYDDELGNLRTQIDTLQSQLELRAAGLTQKRSQLDQLVQSGRYDAYNAAVPDFNRDVQAYNQDADKLRRLTDEYNDTVLKRNEIALEGNELIEAIDSRPKTFDVE